MNAQEAEEAIERFVEAVSRDSNLSREKLELAVRERLSERMEESEDR